MGIWLDAWAGDHAGKVEGRQPYRALISLTHIDGDFPLALVQSGDLDGTTWFFNISATCLTPGSMSAIVIKCEDVGDYVWSLELTPWNFGGSQKTPWGPGVHLFSIMMLGDAGSQSGTIATVVVPAKIRKAVDLSDLAVEKMLNYARAANRFKPSLSG